MRRFPLLRLWAVVTCLWTIAGLLRISRDWLPRADWAVVLGGPWLWVSLGLPPMMFAIILLAIRLIALQRESRKHSQ